MLNYLLKYRTKSKIIFSIYKIKNDRIKWEKRNEKTSSGQAARHNRARLDRSYNISLWRYCNGQNRKVVQLKTMDRSNWICQCGALPISTTETLSLGRHGNSKIRPWFQVLFLSYKTIQGFSFRWPIFFYGTHEITWLREEDQLTKVRTAENAPPFDPKFQYSEIPHERALFEFYTNPFIMQECWGELEKHNYQTKQLNDWLVGLNEIIPKYWLSHIRSE